MTEVIEVNRKVKFKDLSWPIKVGVIGSWLLILAYGFAFMIGFILGIMGV